MFSALALGNLLPQLESVALVMGRMDDRPLLFHRTETPTAFSHLKRLDLSRNQLTPNGVAAAEAMTGEVIADEQGWVDLPYVFMPELVYTS